MATELDNLFNSSMTKQRKLLDLSKVKICCFEDYEKYMDKVPEIPMTLDTVNLEEISSTATDMTFTISRKDRLDLDINCPNFSCLDPLPDSMRGVRMADFFAVDIHWKMLTDLRPVTKMEDDYFNRIVNLGKFRRDTKQFEAKALAAAISNISHCSQVQAKAISLGIINSKSKRGTVETRMKTCKECGLELCTGAFCKVHHYESYARVFMDKDELEAEEAKGFSLKAVISGATAKVDEKAADKAAKQRRAEKRGPSLKAMLVKAKRKGRKRKKKKKQTEETT